MPSLATTDDEITQCYTVMQELRPHLVRCDFLATVRLMQQDGYQLGYIKNESDVVAVAGFRIATNLFMGKHLYVDDLVTAEQQRSKGRGVYL